LGDLEIGEGLLEVLVQALLALARQTGANLREDVVKADADVPVVVQDECESTVLGRAHRLYVGVAL
jgi:hypothetical protein